MGLIRKFDKWLYHRACHYHTPVTLGAIVLMYPLPNLVHNGWWVLYSILLGFATIFIGAILGGKHDHRACKRCIALEPIDKEHARTWPHEVRLSTTRGHYMMNFGFFTAGAVVWTVAHLTYDGTVFARLAALVVSVGVVAVAAGDAMRHYRRLRWCPRCTLRDVRRAQREFWGSAKPWVGKVPTPPHRVPQR